MHCEHCKSAEHTEMLQCKNKSKHRKISAMFISGNVEVSGCTVRVYLQQMLIVCMCVHPHIGLLACTFMSVHLFPSMCVCVPARHSVVQTN